jgi:AcrR family transcriptional regulator
MRTKTEAKRQAILEVATQAFRELGFERTSVAEICNRMGASKATVYNYFETKEALFIAVMFQSSEHEFEAIHKALDPNHDDISEALRQFGRKFLAFIYSAPVMAARRLITAESIRSELGKAYYERGPQKGEQLIQEFLARSMNKGVLRKSKAAVASCHYRSLLESEFIERFMFGLVGEITEREINEAVDRAVDVFMRAYALSKEK